MSNMKKQTSWQEDIARNFSRLFQRSKSQDPDKTEEEDISPSSQENGIYTVSSSLSSEGSHGDLAQFLTEVPLHGPLPDAQLQLLEEIDLNQASGGVEQEHRHGQPGERSGAERVEEEEEEEEPEAAAVAAGGGGGSSVTDDDDDAGGSSRDRPPADLALPRSPVTPSGPGSATPPPALAAETSFFKRLGSLFNFKAEPRPSTQLEDRQEVGGEEEAEEEQEQEQQEEQEAEEQEEEEQEEQEEGTTDPSGMTCGAERDQEQCDPAERQTEEGDSEWKTETEREGRREEMEECVERLCQQSGTDPEAASISSSSSSISSSRLLNTVTQTLENQSSESHEEDQWNVRGESEAPGCGSPKDTGDVTSDEQRRLALACPPVVTYGTYRGQREHHRTRRRAQASSPRLEADKIQQKRDSTSGGEAAVSTEPQSVCRQGEDTLSVSELSESNDIQTLSTNQIRVPSSEPNEETTRTFELDSALDSAPIKSPSHIPVVTQAADSTVSQSAFPSSRDEAGVTELIPVTDHLLFGDKSVRDTPPESMKALADDEISVPVSESLTLDQAETTHWDVARETDTYGGLTEQTETLSALSARTGSPSLDAALLSEPGGAEGTGQVPQAVDTPPEDSQLTPHDTSLLGLKAGENHLQEPVPITRVSDSEDVLGAACEAISNHVKVEGGVLSSDQVLLEDQDLYEEALRSASKTMVDDIMRNALVALQRIESSKLDTETLPESCQVAVPVASAMEAENNFGWSFEPDKLLEVNLPESRDEILPSPASAEKTFSSMQVLGEGPRSTPSSGYESIAGSDTDIRSSPGPVCESSSIIGSTLSVLDELHGEHCSEDATSIGHLAEVKGQDLMNNNKLLASDVASQPTDDVIRSQDSADRSEDDTMLNSRVPLEKQGLHGDGDQLQIARTSDKHEQQSVSGTPDENKGQVVCSTKGNYYNEVKIIIETQGGDVVCLAKDNTEYNGCELQCTDNDNYSGAHQNSLETKLDSSPNDNVSLIQYPKNAMAFCKTLDVSESDLASVRPKPKQQESEATGTVSNNVTETQDNAQACRAGITAETLQSATQMKTIELDKSTIIEDESFALVETYLAAVIEDCSDSGGEDDRAHSPRCTVTVDPASSRTLSEDLRSSDSLLSDSTPGSSNGHRPQWSVGRVTRCDVSSEQQLQDSHAQGHGASAGAMAGFHSDLSSRLSGLHVLGGGRRGVPILDLPACGGMRAQALGSAPLLDLHEMEASSFAIIDEEEEMDTVFINDTGSMLSPTSRRAKAYPFSLSPIVEEDSFRGDGDEVGEGGLSREDMGLLVPPATEEELRSLSGGGGVEQQVAASSISILSLLQSVSERLQSSAFSETDLEESSSPDLQRPLWECFFNRDQGEDGGDMEVDGQCQAPDDDQRFPLYPPCNRHEGPDSKVIGSLSSSHEHGIGLRDESPTEEKNDRLNPQIAVQKPTDMPFYQYLKTTSTLPQPDASDGGHHAKMVTSLSDKTPSNTFEEEEHRSSGKFTPRPTLMHIYSGVTFSGERREIHADQEDAGMVFEDGASVRVLGGCWLLYLEPGFEGPGLVLEEGETVLTHQPGQPSSEEDRPTIVTIGSLRRLVKDDCTPEIHLLPSEASGVAAERVCSRTDSLDARGPVPPSNLSVQSGCWLAYDHPGCDGNYMVMEAGGQSTAGPVASKVTSVRSLRPLRRSGLTVRRPLDPKMLVFEQPHFQGRGRELLGHTPNLLTAGLKGVASLRVVSGIWVGYTGESYTGQQFTLEEGEYGDCEELGGATHPRLLSLRFLQADFIEPLVSLVQETASEKTAILDLDVPDLETAGATENTSFICVMNGIWVAYSERAFSGKQCILEKGKHPATLDFGGSRMTPKSVRPIRLGMCDPGEPKHLLRVYNQPHFEGATKDYKGEVLDCGPDTPMSLRVIRGNWLLFDDQGCGGNQYILGEGLYPDLISCGCVATSVKSLMPIPYSFSDPCLSLFSLDSYEGVMTRAVTSMDNMTNIFTQSLRVDSGLWVAYEYKHYKGRQMLLHPGPVPRWGDHSSWDTIGSIQPLKLPRVYVQLKSRALGSVLTAEDVQDDSSPARVFLSPARSLHTQIWVFNDGLLRSKASKGCLSVIGAKAAAGTRVAVWPEHGRTHQRWTLNEDGTISSHLNRNLVLDYRGGTGFDKDHLVINDLSSDQPTQHWDIGIV